MPKKLAELTPDAALSLPEDKAVRAEISRLADVAYVDKHYGDGQPYNLDRCIMQLTLGAEMTRSGAILAGRALINVQAHEDAPTFAAVVEKTGVGKRMAYTYISAAAMAGHNSDLQKLPLHKLEILFSLPEAQRAALQSAGVAGALTIDAIDKMPLEELRRTVRKLKERLATGEEQVDELKRRVEAATTGGGTSEEFKKYMSMARMGLAFIKSLNLSEIELDVLEFELVAQKALLADLDARVHPENYPVNPASERGKYEGRQRAQRNLKPVTPAEPANGSADDSEEDDAE